MRTAAFLLVALSAVAQDRSAMVRDYINAFNTGDTAMRMFFERYYAADTPVETRLERYRDLRQRFGKLELVQIVNPAIPTARIRIATGETGVFEFRLNKDQPPKLLGVLVQISSGTPQNEAAALSRIRALLDRVSFSGAVLIARGDQVVFESPKTGRYNVEGLDGLLARAVLARLWKAGRVQPANLTGKDPVQVIESASGRKFREFAAETILEPLGMMQTGWDPASGQAYSTPRDLLKFGRAIQSNQMSLREVPPPTRIEPGAILSASTAAFQTAIGRYDFTLVLLARGATQPVNALARDIEAILRSLN